MAKVCQLNLVQQTCYKLNVEKKQFILYVTLFFTRDKNVSENRDRMSSGKVFFLGFQKRTC